MENFNVTVFGQASMTKIAEQLAGFSSDDQAYFFNTFFEALKTGCEGEPSAANQIHWMAKDLSPYASRAFKITSECIQYHDDIKAKS